MLTNVSVISSKEILAYLRACYSNAEYGKVRGMLSELYIRDGIEIVTLIDKAQPVDLCLYTLIRRYVFRKKSSNNIPSCPNCGKVIQLPKYKLEETTNLRCLACEHVSSLKEFE